MTPARLTAYTRHASTLWVLIAAAFVGCATTQGEKATAPLAAEAVSSEADVPPVAQRAVQTIRMEPPAVDGQTSWIIEPDVPRIPKINGLERQLPPHIEQRLSRAFDLAQRGATYSANTEFREVLSLCALELDAREGVTSHREAMRQGLVALDEADEISGQRIDWTDAADVHQATAGHTTPVLHGTVPPGADAIHVVQLYYSYAEERFSYACQGLPGASVAYYGLARTYVQPGARYMHAAGKSAMLHRVALRIAPQNVLACNELGVLLAQHGHLDEAEAHFKRCVATNATPETWQNLAAVYARKGNTEASRAAMAESSRLAALEKVAVMGAANTAIGITGTDTPQNESLATADTTANTINATDSDAKQPKEDRKGLWPRFQLSQRFPNVFHR